MQRDLSKRCKNNIVEYLCEECRQHFDEVKENLELMGVDYEINPVLSEDWIIMKNGFEFVSEDIGAQGTVCVRQI